MTPTVPADLETVSVCVPDHYGRLAGKRVAADRLDAITRSGLDMPDFHLITGPQVQPVPGLSATGEHTGFPNDVLWPDMGTFRVLPWDPASGIVLAEARRRFRNDRSVARDPATPGRAAGPAWPIRLDCLGTRVLCV
jgi:glutamine synthetase